MSECGPASVLPCASSLADTTMEAFVVEAFVVEACQVLFVWVVPLL